MKEQRINIRVKEIEAKELRNIASILDIPAAQLVREALRDKVAELKRTHPRLQHLEITQVLQN